MQKRSAGILLYHKTNKNAEVLLVHPGGPYWATKDEGAWSVPKGEFEEHENPLSAAIRELEEETGIKATGNFIELQPVKQKSGKVVYCWALQAMEKTIHITSNTFEMEWPPRSGNKKSFPEIDKAAWFSLPEARVKIISGQVGLIDELEIILNGNA